MAHATLESVLLYEAYLEIWKHETPEADRTDASWQEFLREVEHERSLLT